MRLSTFLPIFLLSVSGAGYAELSLQVLHQDRVSAPSALTTFDAFIAAQKAAKSTNYPYKSLLASYKGQRDSAHFPLFLDYLRRVAVQEGISAPTITAAFKHITHLKRVISADKNQLEKKVTLEDYLARVLSKARYDEAAKQYASQRTLLTKVSRKTGVPSAYIVALWGLESSFGRMQGKENIFSAVSTLAYEGRRETFFTKQMIDALKVVDKGYISADKMKGSWAGAMGQNQFMPSSLLAYGADGDGDGIIDIWQNRADVFASIANYLATIGWESGVSWGESVTIPASFDRSLIGHDDNKVKSVKEWKQLGVRVKQSTNPPSDEQRAWLIIVDEDINKAYLVYPNFKTLMHWNRSYFFAISVGMLADSMITRP